MDSLPAKHIIGELQKAKHIIDILKTSRIIVATLSLVKLIVLPEGLSHGHHLNGYPIVFATTLDARGPAVFSISKEGHKLIATTGEQFLLRESSNAINVKKMCVGGGYGFRK